MKLLFTPDWFTSGDVLIEGFSFIILMFFFIFSIRNYKINKNRNSLYLGVGFFLIALAELSVILTKVVLFYDMTFTSNIGRMVVTYNVVKSVDTFYYIGLFLQKLLTLVGLYVIYKLHVNNDKSAYTGDFFLALYFLVISVLFSTALFHLFHITVLILLVLIINHYYEVYKKNKHINTKILLVAFCMLAFSQVIFMLSNINPWYVIAQMIQLVSYITLLVLIIRILRAQNGTKEEQGRHNIRYAGNNPRKRKG